MPNKNGSGPLGQGPASGRGQGFCTDRDAAEKLQRFGRGTGRGMCCRSTNEAERPPGENDRPGKSRGILRRRRERFREE